MQTRSLILGSTSPYRRELLSRLRIPFSVQSPEVDETPHTGERPLQLAQRLALAKAKAVAEKNPNAVVIGSDQVADLNGMSLGKPGNFERAMVQLRQMSGQTIVFQTALAVVCLDSGFEQADLASVRVQFRVLSDAEIAAYLHAEKPYDCAGSAKSEGLGIALLESIANDDPTALVGLPLIRTCNLIARCRRKNSMTATQKGRLFLVPAPLDFGCDVQQNITDSLPMATLQTAANIQHWVCENAKTTRAFLKRVNDICPLSQPLQSLSIQELPREVHKKGDHAGSLGEGFDAKPLLQSAKAGSDIGLISEAGMPAIADPGSSVVRAAHTLGIDVIPLVGPISLMLALAASGLNGQNFAFIGYLPQDAEPRSKRIKELETLSRQTHQTQLFIETPYRNAALLKVLLQNLNPQTHLSLSLGLTLNEATTCSKKVALWRQNHAELPISLPAVFGILA